jgi:hypothetical protein
MPSSLTTIRRAEPRLRQPQPEESSDSEKFNCTPGAILPINEDERLERVTRS